jgi:hypothetical protein
MAWHSDADVQRAEEDAAADQVFDRELDREDGYRYSFANYPEGWGEPR